MPRIARLIAPGIPHHVTQRGNRRMETFFCEEDYQAYLALMAEWCRKFNVAIWAYCLMPNHYLCGAPHKEVLCEARSYVKTISNSPLFSGIDQRFTAHK
jgi:putative transposase